jgi:Fe-S oxidoreductase
MWMEEHIGRRTYVTRLEQGLDLDPKVIATACPYCAVMLCDGLKAKNLTETMLTRDVAELVAAAMVPRAGKG